jgi:uncharacterized protein YndB with AHSA1/START domain
MAANRIEAASAESREIVVTRIINAPRELVWEAWTDPKRVVHWWGPDGFTTTIEKMDVRVGGVWKHVMHGPDGTDYPNKSIFTEVVKPERISYTHGGSKKGSPEVSFEATWTFEDLGGKTRVTGRSLFPTAEARDLVVKVYGAIEGGKQHLARLDGYLAGAPAAASCANEFVITRQFHAPRDLVWNAWANAEALAQWWGPKGCKLHVASLDFRPGGIFHYAMDYSTGAKMWGRFLYRDIVAPERIAWLNSFATENGGIARAPFSAHCPLEILNTVTLTEKNGQTTLSLRARPFGANAEECQYFTSIASGMEQGFGGTFDQLAEFLKAKA